MPSGSKISVNFLVYPKSNKGLSVTIVAQAIGVSRQAVSKYGRKNKPTYKTLKKIADAMTDMGVPTTVVEIFAAIEEE